MNEYFPTVRIYLGATLDEGVSSMPSSVHGDETEAGEQEMVAAMEGMLQSGETITARAVTRRVASFKHASSIIRSARRSELLKEFQGRQTLLRSAMDRLRKDSREKLAETIAEKERTNAELKGKYDELLIVNVAMIRVVAEMGGVTRLVRLFEDSERILALPKSLRSQSESALGPESP